MEEGTERDVEALDAYSAAVTRVVRELAPSVASLAVLDRPGGRQLGAGSAVVLEPGVLVTNAHVAGAAGACVASFTDGTQTECEVVGVDRLSDLAVLRARRPTPPPARFGDANTLQVGQLVVALGNPLGMAGSVTAGVVSGLGRSLPAQSGRHVRIIEDVIQTDAALNPGNSGGALADSSARVVGISTAVAGVGLGLAVPINATTRRILQTLQREGRVRRAYLGVAAAPSPLPPPLAARLGREQGIRLAHVEVGSPAGHAGLHVGDLVVTVGGQPVADAQALQRRLFAHPPGEPLAITTFRNGAMVDVIAVPVELEER
jgi:S1-C subfamily serine protease